MSSDSARTLFRFMSGSVTEYAAGSLISHSAPAEREDVALPVAQTSVTESPP